MQSWTPSRARLVCAVLIGLAVLSIGSAQTPIVNPTTLTFAASSDHATNVTSYAVEVNRVSGGIAAQADIGKPAPTGPDITTSLTSLLASVPSCADAATACYNVTVVAKNGFGTARSAASVPFSVGRAPGAPGVPVLK
jgi:hypothetical protein